MSKRRFIELVLKPMPKSKNIFSLLPSTLLAYIRNEYLSQLEWTCLLQISSSNYGLFSLTSMKPTSLFIYESLWSLSSQTLLISSGILPLVQKLVIMSFAIQQPSSGSTTTLSSIIKDYKMSSLRLIKAPNLSCNILGFASRPCLALNDDNELKTQDVEIRETKIESKIESRLESNLQLPHLASLTIKCQCISSEKLSYLAPCLTSFCIPIYDARLVAKQFGLSRISIGKPDTKLFINSSEFWNTLPQGLTALFIPNTFMCYNNLANLGDALPNLKSLEFYAGKANSDPQSFPVSLSSLTDLRMSGGNNMVSVLESLNGSIEPHVSMISTLTSLSIVGTRRHIHAFQLGQPNLAIGIPFSIPQVQFERMMNSLSSCISLTELSLFDCVLPDLGISILAETKSPIRKLSMSIRNIDSALPLSSLSNTIEILSLRVCRLNKSDGLHQSEISTITALQQCVQPPLSYTCTRADQHFPHLSKLRVFSYECESRRHCSAWHQSLAECLPLLYPLLDMKNFRNEHRLGKLNIPWLGITCGPPGTIFESRSFPRSYHHRH